MRADWSAQLCTMARGIDAVGDPWSLLVMRELLSGNRRFEQIKAKLGIADNILAARLRRLVEFGIVERVPYLDGARTRDEYHPTEAGHEVLPILHAFSLWAEKHTPTSGDRQRVVIVCRECGAHSATGERCSSCGVRLTTDTTAWIKPSDPTRTARPLVGHAG